MDYFTVENLLKEAKDELLEKEDDSSIMASMSAKLFNQGVRMMFYKAILIIYELELKGKGLKDETV